MKLIKRPPYRPQVLGGKKMTQPARYVSVQDALGMYRANTLEEKMKAHWDSEGIEMPDLTMLNKIQRLELLNEYRESVIKSRQKLRDIDEKSAITYKQQQENERRAIEQREAVNNAKPGENGGKSTPNQ